MLQSLGLKSLTRLSMQNTWFLYMLLFNETSR